MLADFTLWDFPGWVEVAVEPNYDPGALGTAVTARGFPVCTATVTYRGRGYHAALGWIQLVKSTDNSSGGGQFEMDPFEPLGRLAHPFCFFGFAPTLFDAPSRDSRAPLVWTAHSFLAFIAEDDEGWRPALSWASAGGSRSTTRPSLTKHLLRSPRRSGTATGHSWTASIPAGVSPTAIAATRARSHGDRTQNRANPLKVGESVAQGVVRNAGPGVHLRCRRLEVVDSRRGSLGWVACLSHNPKEGRPNERLRGGPD